MVREGRYTVLFDVLRESYEPNLGLLALAFGVSCLIVLYGLQGRTGAQRARVILSGASVLAFVLFLEWTVWRQYGELQERYRSGAYEELEGCVTQFDIGSAAGNRPQSFQVGDRRFSFYGVARGPDFHHTVRSGGPNFAGHWVRVRYLPDGRIMWLGSLGRARCSD